MNGALFVAYVEQQLAAALRAGDIVIMDNLAVHKLAGVRTAIEAAGATERGIEQPFSPEPGLSVARQGLMCYNLVR